MAEIKTFFRHFKQKSITDMTRHTDHYANHDYAILSNLNTLRQKAFKYITIKQTLNKCFTITV